MASVDFTGVNRIVKFFYDPEPRHDENLKDPIWCLGQQYNVEDRKDDMFASDEAVHVSREDAMPTLSKDATSTDSATTSIDSSKAYSEVSVKDNGRGWPEPFLDDFESKIWLTYRSGFSSIAKSQDSKAASSITFAVRLRNLTNQGGFTSDTGFGCMIRSGQSLLANAILISRLGRDWRRKSASRAEKEVLALFADDPKAPYSLHKFVEHGALACGKNPGEWFGPSATASCIQELTNNCTTSTIRVYVTGDGSDVYEDSFMAVAKPDGSKFSPTVILIGTRLGINQVTPAYYGALTALLQMTQSMGIAGGRPSASHYFIGSQGPNLFYLDPHITRQALPLHSNVDDYTAEEVDSCHTRRLRSINVKEMDPSMLIGFLINDEEDWKKWRKGISSNPGKAIVHIADRFPAAFGNSGERTGAIDEVESFDDTDDDDDTILVEA